MNEPINHENENDTSTKTQRRSKLGASVWLAVAFVVAFFATSVYLPRHSSHFVVKFFALWAIGTLLGYVGIRCGDAVRRVFQPDILIVKGGISDAIWVRLCWSIGPQTVGMFLGGVTGTSIVAGWIA
ncbi:hypothetical protein [Pandoraea apista]|uniref:hypothetical protein n=1 Tax=Pandoraea apista TaxID=93218 RepID=UPI00058A9DE3|nr:hypothetical protein [Pandoraea apista]AJE99141.1 hypothetical protein SG18_14820 [Pandoraea apista]AKH73240.1 hypothetical protein XM39_15015 [Pandoraea apista]AKI61636.1 hypothetical protein AA956_07355 [Pandoraea apista]